MANNVFLSRGGTEGLSELIWVIELHCELQGENIFCRGRAFPSREGRGEGHTSTELLLSKGALEDDARFAWRGAEQDAQEDALREVMTEYDRWVVVESGADVSSVQCPQ